MMNSNKQHERHTNIDKSIFSDGIREINFDQIMTKLKPSELKLSNEGIVINQHMSEYDKIYLNAYNTVGLKSNEDSKHHLMSYLRTENQILNSRTSLASSILSSISNNGFMHSYGCIVAASLKINNGFWPALIIDPYVFNLPTAKSGYIWVYWYGTNQISQINPKNRLKAYRDVFSAAEFYKKSKSVQRAMKKAYLDLMYRNILINENYDVDDAELKLKSVPDLLSNENSDMVLPLACLHDVIDLDEELFKTTVSWIKLIPNGTLSILKNLQNNFLDKTRQFMKSEKSPTTSSISDSSPNSNFITSNSQYNPLVQNMTQIATHENSTSEDESLNDRHQSKRPINDKIQQMWRQGKLSLNDVCVSCWNNDVFCEHPFFEGGLCKQDRSFFMECVFMISDEDGCYFYCSVCGHGGNLFVCANDNCKRVYCSQCMETFYSPEEIDAILKDDLWSCELCRVANSHSSEMVISKTLNRRINWQKSLADMFLPEKYTEITFQDGIPKRELRVLSLFDGISTGLVVLDKLNIKVDSYFASEINSDAINISKMNHGSRVTHIGDVRNIDLEMVKSMLPIDLIIGGSPCNDFSAVNPTRKGIYDFSGTGPLFFEFFRLLQMVRILQPDLNVFWLFENVSSMNQETKRVIDRFLGCNPALWDAVNFSPQHRSRYMWGNIPGMHHPPSDYHTMVGLSLSLDEILIKNLDRKAKVQKVRTITTMTNSLYSNSRSKNLPVKMGDSDSNIWITELEQIFGFTPHYTDIGYLSPNGRLKVLGVCWSVNVIKHLLQPLKEFFITN